MCIQIIGEEFNVIYYELGYNYYQCVYNQELLLYCGLVNDGFYEVIGDIIVLFIMLKYLKEIGLIDEIFDLFNDVGMLLQIVLDKIVFILFGLMVD